MSKIESRTTTKVSKEIELFDLSMKHDEPKKIEKVNEPKQVESSKEVKHEFRGRCFI